jgi:hypothetical protein
MSQTKDQFSAAIARFVEFLSLPRRRRFPHEEFLSFIKKLEETVNLLRSECTSAEVGILASLLKSLCAFEFRFAGPDGIEFAKGLLRAIENLFQHVLDQVLVVCSLEPSFAEVTRHIEDLSVLAGHLRSEVEDRDMESDGTTWEDVLRHPCYKLHYKARHRDFLSQVVVVLWTNDAAGPAQVHDGLPVIYVQLCRSKPSTREEAAVMMRSYTEQEMAEARRVQEVLARNTAVLFERHSHLTGAKCKRLPSNEFVIELVVPCVGFTPVANVFALPTEIEGVRVVEVQGIFELC